MRVCFFLPSGIFWTSYPTGTDLSISNFRPWVESIVRLVLARSFFRTGSRCTVRVPLHAPARRLARRLAQRHARRRWGRGNGRSPPARRASGGRAPRTARRRPDSSSGGGRRRPRPEGRRRPDSSFGGGRRRSRPEATTRTPTPLDQFTPPIHPPTRPAHSHAPPWPPILDRFRGLGLLAQLQRRPSAEEEGGPGGHGEVPRQARDRVGEGR